MNQTKKFVVIATIIQIFLISHALGGQSFQGKLVKVLDGDTVEVLNNGTAERIRLAEIDCPEKGQPFGGKAKEFVLGLGAGKTVTVKVSGKDRYGRTIGEVLLPDGQNLNQRLVQEGLAWQYRRYSSDEMLGALEARARKERRGLWTGKEPIPPWEWRRGKR